MNPTGMIQLKSWNADSLTPLFNTLAPRLLSVEAALTKQTSGSLYVDTAETPQAAALHVDMCWHIVGTPSPEFLKGINLLLPRDTYSVLGPTITASHRKILFEDLYFVCAKSRYAERTSPTAIYHPLYADYAAPPIDRQLLESDLEGAADLREGILHNWQSLKAFGRNGFGFAVIQDARIVSHSLTDYVCGDLCEIGVNTEPDHRLKGLGSHVASLTANEAFARGIERVGWMSWANNAGSVAVSARAGFTEACEYDVYINHWPAENPDDLTTEEFRVFPRTMSANLPNTPRQAVGIPTSWRRRPGHWQVIAPPVAINYIAPSTSDGSRRLISFVDCGRSCLRTRSYSRTRIG